MFVLRYAYVLALSIWLGSMVALGSLAAPATFQVLEARVPDAGRVLAGAVFGEILRRFHPLAYACGAVLAISLVGMALLGPRPINLAVRLAIVSVMLVLSLYSGLVVSREIERLQAEIGAPVNTLPADDARRVRFGRLHGLSTILMMINIGGALALLSWETRE